VSGDGVRRLGPSDLEQLLLLQSHVLADTISARLGAHFNRVFHETMLADDNYLCDGYFADGVLVGYLSYTPDTLRLLRIVFRRNVIAYVRALVADVVRTPRTLLLIARVARSVALNAPASAPSVGAELLSVGVLPAFRGARSDGGRGSSVADTLLQGAVSSLRTRGARTVCLVAKPEDVDQIPHRFVRKYGFTSAGRVKRFGLDAELYVLELEVDPASEASAS
jgi:ribosomal protein S18 acetylase RimI-like enzyme